MFLADRVYVMSPAPGASTRVIDIDLPRPRTLALEESPQFAAHEARLREALRAGRRPGSRPAWPGAVETTTDAEDADG